MYGCILGNISEGVNWIKGVGEISNYHAIEKGCKIFQFNIEIDSCLFNLSYYLQILDQ